MPVRSIFSIDGLNIGKADRSLTYFYGLSDFWASMFEDSEKIELLLEAESLKLSDIYSRFLQLASSISITDIEIATSQQIKLLLIKDTDAVPGKLNTYKLPEVITEAKYAANRLLLPTAYLESNVHFSISPEGTEIQFYDSLSSIGFATRLIEEDGETTRQYSIWLVDSLVDEQALHKHFGKLIGISPEIATENFKNFIFGLYYLYTNGPNLALLRKGLNLALGIPLARETETVLDIRKYLDTDQFVVITDLNSYLIPFGLAPTVAVGDTLQATQELAQWVEVKDYINDGVWWINLAIPSTIMPYIPPGEPDRYAKVGTYADYVMSNFLRKHTFLVNVKTIDFKNIQNFAQLSSIIDEVKPSYTYPIYIWTVPNLEEVIDIDDDAFTKEIHQPKGESLTVPIGKFKRFLPKYTGYNEFDTGLQNSYGTPTKLAEDGDNAAARASKIALTPDTGKYYWEAYVNSLPLNVLTPQFRIGVGTNSANLDDPVGHTTASWGYDGMSSFVSKTSGETWTTQGVARVQADRDNYLDLDGLSFMSTPNNTGQNFAGDIDLVCKANVAPYITDTVTLISKWDSTTNNRAYLLQVTVDGIVRLLTSPDGSTIYVHESTAPISLGTSYYIRAALDVDDGAGNRVATFYVSGNGLNWTQLGNTVTKPGTTSIYQNSTAQVLLGSTGFSPTFEIDFANTGSIVPVTGQSPTFSRNTTATAIDYDGVVKNVLSGEARFLGMRRVQNLLFKSEDISNTTYFQSGGVTFSTGISDPLGTNRAVRATFNGTFNQNIQLTASQNVSIVAGRTYTFSIWAKLVSGTPIAVTSFALFTEFASNPSVNLAIGLTNQWQRFSVTATATGSLSPFNHNNLRSDGAIVLDLFGWQVEDVTGQSVQNSGEYVSVGILSSPYHGANVDGVKYLPTYNSNVVRQNNLLQSQTLDNASWIKTNCSVSPNITLAPDGTLTADKLVEDTSNAAHQLATSGYTSAVGQYYTDSVYLKAAERPRARLIVSSSHVTGGASAIYDLSSGVVVSSTNATAAISSVGSGWYRCSITYKADKVGSPSSFVQPDTGTTNVYLGDGVSGIYAWGAQSQPGLRASTYVPTTTTTVNTGIVEQAAGDLIPTSIRLGYLAEGARENLCKQSENFTVAPWVGPGSPIITPDAATCGSVSLSLLDDNSAAGTFGYSQTITFTGDGSKAVSFFFKEGTSNTATVLISDGTAATERGRANITWSSGTPTVTGTGGCVVDGVDALAGGVYRARVHYLGVIAANSNTLNIFPATTGGTGSIYYGGIQVENASFSTTYIPTTTIAVTRNQDSLVYSTKGWVNTSVGTFYTSFRTAPGNDSVGSSDQLLGFDDGTSSNSIVFMRSGGDLARWNSRTNAVVDVDITAGSLPDSTDGSAAFCYANNDYALSSNGVAATIDTVATVPPAFVNFKVGTSVFGYNWHGTISKIGYLPRRISNSGLQLLSSNQPLIGSDTTGISYSMSGRIYNAAIRSGVGGLTAIGFDAQNGNATDLTPVSSSTNNVWTFNNSARISTELSPYYAELSGEAGSYLMTPDSVANSVTGDLEIKVKIAADNFATGAIQELVSKSLTDSSQFAYLLRLNATGTVQLYWSTNGSTLTNRVSTQPLPYTQGMPLWVKATLDVDNGSSGNDVKFFTSQDGVNWVQLGSTITSAGATSIFDSNQPVMIGRRAATGSNHFIGKFYYAEIRKGINGPIVASFDANDARTLTGGNWITNNVKTAYGSALKVGDTLGVLYDSDLGNLTFYVNGVSQGLAASGINTAVYPMMSLLSPDTVIETNFGDKDFNYAVPDGASNGIYTEDVYITRDVPYFTRSTVSYFMSGQFGEQSQINGAVRTYEGGVISGYVNSVRQLRPNTLEERAWYRSEFTRDSESYRNQRSIMTFLRDNVVAGDTGVGERHFKQNDADVKAVFLYATTQKDIENKFAAVGAEAPGLEKWVFTLFSNSLVGNEGINSEGINEGSSVASYYDAMVSSFDTIFFRSETYDYLGAYMPKVGYQTYAPLVTDLQEGDYLLFIRIYENIVGVYWVTSNAAIHSPCFRVAESLDGFSVQNTNAPIQRGLSYYSSYYTVRGAGGEFTYAIGMGINEVGINEAGDEATNPITISYADDENITPVIVDRNGTVLKFRRDFK